MSAGLADLEIRIRAALHDSPGLVYDATTLEEAVRQALGLYNLAAAAPATLAGLDGASETTLPALHESLIAYGAAAFAAQARAAEQAGRAAPDGDPAGLRAWADERLETFRQLMAAVFEIRRLNQLRASPSAPWSAWADPED